MDYESELAKLLFVYEKDFMTFYALLDSKNPFDLQVDITSQYDFTYKSKKITYQFDVMKDQQECVVEVIKFLQKYGTHFENLMISSVKNTPVVSIYVTKEIFDV